MEHTWLEPFPSVLRSSTSSRTGRRLEDHGSTVPGDLSLGRMQTLPVVDGVPAAEQQEQNGTEGQEHSHRASVGTGGHGHCLAGRYPYQRITHSISTTEQITRKFTHIN